MALETLRNVPGMERGQFIVINDNDNTLTFKIQEGPVKENGLNGCQVDDVIEIAQCMVDGLNRVFSCPENEECIAYLRAARDSLKARTRDRETRGVEGYDKE